MGRLVGLAVLAVVLYQGYKHAGPWIEQRFGAAASEASAGGGGDDQMESANCISRARRAASSLSDSMRQFSQPPVDKQEWTSAFLTVSGDIGAADDSCACTTDACYRAAEAVSELRDLSLSFDGTVRGGSRGISNPARGLERVYDLLDEAESLSGS